MFPHPYHNQLWKALVFCLTCCADNERFACLGAPGISQQISNYLSPFSFLRREFPCRQEIVAADLLADIGSRFQCGVIGDPFLGHGRAAP